MIPEGLNRIEDERWKCAYEWLERAERLPDGERASLSQETIQDPEVRRLVRELLDTQPEPDRAPDARRHAWAHLGKNFGRFWIEGTLGRGGMGEVYCARDTELNRPVAMKFLSTRDEFSSPAVERFIQEARAASALNHPGIVTVYEVVRTDDSSAIVMELVNGTPLRNLCGEPRPAAEVARWGSQIAEALAAAHEGGVVHRDIKPENLMLRPDGYVKVLDFGAAVQLGSGDDLARIPIGTLGYMSPEQLEGRPLTGASDVFLLGVVLTELACGRHPFRRETAALTSLAVKSSDHGLLTGKGSRLPEPLGPLLRSMLDTTPERRPSAADVARRLAAIERDSAASRWRGWGVPVAVLLAVCVSLAVLLSTERAPSSSAPNIVPLTAYEGIEKNPSFSPDGGRVAFSWNGPDRSNWDIYIKAVGEDVPHRLTTDLAADSDPVWSPDGRQIAFLRSQSGSDVQLLMTVPAHGGLERKIGSVDANVMGVTHPIAWWPDSRSLVYRRAIQSPGGLGLYRRFLDTGKDQFLTGFGEIVSQPVPIDDRRLVLVQNPGGRRSRVCLTVSFGELHCLEPGEMIDGVVLEAGRKSLLYSTPSAIWRVALDGDRLGRVTRILSGSFPELTGDRQGRRLAFTKSYRDLNIWRITTHGQQPRRLIASSAEDTNAEYSPDGEQIAFTSTRSGHSEAYVAGKDGSGARQLTTLGGKVAAIAWSPDGKLLAFDAMTSDAAYANVYVMPSAGGAPRRITGDHLAALDPVWSRDGRWIYYSQGRQALYKIPWNGGTPVKLPVRGKLDPQFSVDGKSLYFMVENTREGGIRRLDLASGSESVITGTERAIKRNWALARDGIYFLEGETKPMLRFLEFQTNRIRTVADFPGVPYANSHAFAISPDGSSLLYTSVDTDIGDIMLLEGVHAAPRGLLGWLRE